MATEIENTEAGSPAVSRGLGAVSPAVSHGMHRFAGLWDYYGVTIQVAMLVAGVPANEKTMQAWLDTHNVDKEARREHLESLDRQEVEDQKTVVFYRDSDGNPCLEGRCVKGAFKEAANVLKEIMGKKAWRAKLAERVFVVEHALPITSEIKIAERPLTVMTMQGPRTSLKRYEYAENVVLDFTLKVLKDKMFTHDELTVLLEYISENGLGSDRSQGAGTFDVIRIGAL